MTNGRKPAGKIDLNHLHLHVRNLDRAQRFYESYFRFGNVYVMGIFCF